MQRTALRNVTASGAIFAALLSIIDFAAAGTASPRHRVLGCWKQTSPYPATEIPADKNEWGERTWCFRPRGLLETWDMACGRGGGCDGWDGLWHYRWRGPNLELENGNYQDKGPTVWLRCLPAFRENEFVLTNCEMSKYPFVRVKDPNKTE
jgi:hypothetical protein